MAFNRKICDGTIFANDKQLNQLPLVPMNQERIILLLAFVLLGLGTSAQDTEPDWRLYHKPTTANNGDSTSYDTITSVDFNKTGVVTYKKDPRIASVNEKLKDNLTIELPGYRVQLKLSQDRTSVNLDRARFLKLETDHKAHVDYNAPNFLLKVGDFSTRQQAVELKYELQEIFPGAIVVSDGIELPNLPTKTSPDTEGNVENEEIIPGR